MKHILLKMYDILLVLKVMLHFYKIGKDNCIVVIIIFVNNVISMIVQFIKFIL